MHSGTVVMVVDDDAVLRETVCDFLEHEHCQPIGMGSARDALAHLQWRTPRPDLILLDLDLPGMTGREFRELQLGDPSIAAVPVVLLSGSSGARDVPADEVLSKPVCLDRLAAVVRRYDPHEDPLFTGGGAMGVTMRAFDWAATPLGPSRTWPASLRIGTSICLSSRVPMAVYWGPDLIALYNDAYAAILGEDHGPALGHPCREHWSARWDETGPLIEAVRAGSGATSYDQVRRTATPGGAMDECNFTYWFSPIRDPRGAVAGVLAAVVDNTARVQAEARVRELEIFTGIVAHDLRSPLAGILATAQLMLRRPAEVGGETPVALERIVRTGKRMHGMIEQLLDFTRLRLGHGLELRPRPVSLGDLVGQVVDELAVVHPDRIQVQSEADLRGRWDPDRLLQVVANLLANALAHGDPATPVLVRLDGTRAERVLLRVHNDGVIPADQLAHVFEPFHQTRPTAVRGRSGLGLGLFITQEIVAAHGGTVEVTSSEATDFVVELPRTPPAPRAPGPS